MLPHPDPVLCAALASDLASAGYSSEALRQAWGVEGDAAIGRGLRHPALRRLAQRDDALAVLARLLGLGLPQPVETVDAALPATGAAGMERLGLVTLGPDGVVPTALVRPQAFADSAGEGEWWIASDLDEAALGGALPEDHVLGVGGASLTLAGLQLTDPAASGLDLGTGCGIQALRMRREVERVVATDISERALRFTRLNALLNGVDGIETRRGSLFEPVAGERFGRIVSNPPFVITPRAPEVPAYEYRDGGLVGDALVASVVAGVGDHLEPGGVAQLLGNWETHDQAPGLERVRGWVEASPVPLDAWVVERDTLDPLAYAELWIRDGGTQPGSPRFAELVDAWLDDFAARGVASIGFGYILLRRRVEGASPFLRFESVRGSVESALGAHLSEALAAADRLAALDDEGLAASRFAVASDVTEARHHRPGESDPTVIELRQGGGFGRSVSVDSALAALVGACDGDLSLGALSDAIAHLLSVDAGALRADLTPRVRELVVTGFLRFADCPAARLEAVLSMAEGVARLNALAESRVIATLADAFARAGHELAIVGGPVRDALLGRSVNDLDFTTDARPDDILRIVTPVSSAQWDIGRAFGTIGARVAGEQVEITTYRADSYDGVTRKPTVEFGDTLEADLSRRDFTVNSMALRVPSRTLVDPTGGVEDLVSSRLRTPSDPAVSFGDDPLRMLRAARFAAQLGFEVDPATLEAMAELASTLEIVSPERIQGELVRLLQTDDPVRGIRILVDTGLIELFLPEVPALRLEVDEHHHHKDVYEHSLTVLRQAIDLEHSRHPGAAPDVPLRLAALLHDIGKPATRRLEPGGGVTFHHHDIKGSRMARKRLQALRFDSATIEVVARLVELHLRFFGYAEGTWTDSAVRRYVRDAGDELERLHILTRADVTTRNRRKAARLAGAYDDLEGRIAALREQEEIDSVRPELDGNRIQEVLGIRPGPEVGQAYRFLLDLRLDEGPLGEEEAERRLREWWAARGTAAG